MQYRLDEIEEERRQGYSWYSDCAATLINRDYPAWNDRIR